MIDVLLVLPDDGGWETSTGEVVNFTYDENEPVAALFDTIKKKLGAESLRLSLETKSGNTAALKAFDPEDPATVGSRVTPGARILVGYGKEQ